MTIPEINRLHKEAMHFVDLADIAKKAGNAKDAARFTRLSFDYERVAAEAVVAHFLHVEPTRSVLLRSAATLAAECGELDEAIRLLHLGFSGDPPREIAAEMCEVMGEVMKAVQRDRRQPS